MAKIDKSSVPVFVLAGGLGTRISEETQLKPKPMIEIGGIPLLTHIMRSYYRHGFTDFVICAGYRSWEIKNYFLNYEFRKNHLAIDNRLALDSEPTSFGRCETQEKWRVRVIDTGVDCYTGGRLARAIDLVSQDTKFEHFAVTYGDGVSSVDLTSELEFHTAHNKIGTVLSVAMQVRFGVLNIVEDGLVTGFIEKPENRQERVSGGFFFFRKGFREYLSPDERCILERTPLEKLTLDRQLMSFAHKGFRYPMDTLRDKNYLEELWHSGKVPWLDSASPQLN